MISKHKILKQSLESCLKHKKNQMHCIVSVI